ncbi:hypothetical protein TQ29_02295 [Actibacterium sp. EMB200-NS6]|nr:hypothetical protein TQ29_02295 [Actibacterium sp. EMB200-NS6]
MDLLNLVLNALMLLVWVVYLHLILMGFLRQRQCILHLDLGAATDENARCIVTNMGSEPVYLAAVVIDLSFENRQERYVITDRSEMPLDQADRPLERTIKGPLAGGEALDLGSFRDLVGRSVATKAIDETMEALTAVTVTAVAVSNHAQSLTGGYKRFDVYWDGHIRMFRPNSVITSQVRGIWRRRDLAGAIAGY